MELNAVCPTSGQSRAREGAVPQAHACGSVWLVARAWVSKKLSPETLACIFRHLTAEAHDRPAITSVRLLAVLNVGFKNVGARHAVPEGVERRAPWADGPLTHFRLATSREAG